MTEEKLYFPLQMDEVYTQIPQLQQHAPQRLEEDLKIDKIDIIPTCCCGESMSKKQISYGGKRDMGDMDWISGCSACSFTFYSVDKKYIYFQCPTRAHPVHPQGRGYRLCLSCTTQISHFNKDPIKDIHNTKKLYFIYSKKQIIGPYSTDQIISLYINMRLDKKYIYIQSVAGKDKKWYKLTFKQSVFSNVDTEDEKICNLMTKCQTINAEIKQKFPVLYKNLVENILSHKITQVRFPDDIPVEERKSFCEMQRCAKFLGRVLAGIMFIIITIHIFPTMIISCFIWCFIMLIVICINNFCCVNCPYLDVDPSIPCMVFTYFGMCLTPLTVVYLILSQTNIFDGVQSWMIAYIGWGFAAFLIAVLLSLLKNVALIGNLIFFIVGIELEYSVSDIGNQWAVFATFTVISSIASLFPAAICGFIGNFILEEKFELKCGEGIYQNEYLCTDSQTHDGCCEIISNHDSRFFYEFIGTLASNILAAWAVIRICGFLLIKAWPSLSMFAKRRR
eukprot:499737_1